MDNILNKKEEVKHPDFTFIYNQGESDKRKHTRQREGLD